MRIKRECGAEGEVHEGEPPSPTGQGFERPASLASRAALRRLPADLCAGKMPALPTAGTAVLRLSIAVNQPRRKLTDLQVGPRLAPAAANFPTGALFG